MTFVCPCFLRLTSLFFFSFFSLSGVVVLQPSASIQRKIVQDCKSTLNQHRDGKQSLICQQQSMPTAL